MAERKTFPLRMDPAVFEALQRWADDELRSLNGQIEYVLREALRQSGRSVRPSGGSAPRRDTDPPAPDDAPGAAARPD